MQQVHRTIGHHTRARVVFATAWMGLLVALAPRGGSAHERLARPHGSAPLNLLFILVDDLGWSDLGCYGSTFYETPRVDRLAASGMRFIDAYAACPVCSPTRASILTGKYPARTGITTYINPGGANQPANWRRRTPLLPAPYKDRMALEEVTLAEALREAGYATFFAGKWHLGPEGYWPEDQGFDVNKGGCERGGPYGGKKYFSPYDNPRLQDGPPGEHLPDRLARETVAFIEAHSGGPFLAYLSFYSVHTPLMSREDLRAKYRKKREALEIEGPIWGREGARRVRLVQENAVYAGMVEAMDQAVGRVLDAVDRLDLRERTVVIFMSDNGGLSTSEGHPTSNLPLRGGKGWLYEGGIREPMIVRWPGVTAAGKVCHEPIISTDFYPTILEILGLTPRPEQHRDGRSFTALLRGRSMEPRLLFWHFPHYGNQGGAPGAAVFDGRFKLIERYEDGGLELYDLESDIGEKRNLAADRPEERDALRTKLHAWLEKIGAVMPKPNPSAHQGEGKKRR